MVLLQIHEPGQTPLPHEKDKKLAIGIDLGTTYSVVALSRQGQPEILRSSTGNSLIPSVVAITRQGHILVGDEAIAYGQENPKCIISSIKRLMGKTKEDFAKDPWGLTLPWSTEQQPGLATLHLGNGDYNPIVLSSYILTYLKRMAEDHLGHDVNEAVITVPAYFDDAARTATRQAAQLAGLDVLRLVNEPTAAALAYGLDKGVEGIYAVYDLGGGTFDFSLLRLQKGVFQVLGTGGHTTLGGDDADFALVQALVPNYQNLSPSTLKQWCRHARNMREQLSVHDQGQWSITVDQQTRTFNLNRQQLEDLLMPLVAKTLTVCQDVLADVDLEPAHIHGVVLVGGMTRTPLIQRQVEVLFGKKPLIDINPDKVVAMGAALQAEALTTGSDTLLLDVVPLSLGLEMMGGLVEKIVPRNSPIPIAKTQEFTTYQDNQTGMIIHVVQGEREFVHQCRSLARFELRDIPPMVAGAARIRITFRVDADGLLTVEAEETTTCRKQIVEVKPSYGLQPEEIEHMIYDSLTHAKEDIDQRLLVEARIEAEQFLHATTQALDEDRSLLSFKELAAIQKAISYMQKALVQDDPDAIRDAMQKLEKTTHSFAEKRMHKAFQERVQGRTIEEVEKWTKDHE